MYEIKAIIRPFKLDDVITALHKIDGLPGITISDINANKPIVIKNPNRFIREYKRLLDSVRKPRILGVRA